MHLERNPIECVNECVSVCVILTYSVLDIGTCQSCDNITGSNIANGQRAEALRL